MKFSLTPFVYITILISSFSCTEQEQKNMPDKEKIVEQLTKISSLLQDSSFTRQMAESLEAAYYIAENKPVPPFSTPENITLLNKSIREEKIATGVAPLYALECGIGELMEEYNGIPIEWLDKIVNEQLDSAQILILNRFANATWKAGQPFRGLDRIKRPVFISAYLLPPEEVKKDYDHILSTAVILRGKMLDIKDSSKTQQLQRISELMKSEQFAFDIASNAEALYYTAQNQPIPPFLKQGEDSATKKQNAVDEKIAVNIAGFYALECGLSFLATTKNALPSTVLETIIADNINTADKKLLERFANATWKAGQPFRGLNRITRDIFMPFDLLSPSEVDKDWIQIKAAAQKISIAIK